VQLELILALLFAIPVMLLPVALLFDINMSKLCRVLMKTDNNNNGL
jgi:hypothetical protein